MAGEYPARVGKEFVEKACIFLSKLGFHIYQNCYEGKNAATVLVNGERVRFDIIVDQTRKGNDPGILQQKIHYFCECKWRNRPGDLKFQLKKFLGKALKSIPEIQGQCTDNFGFVFVCNKSFQVNQENLQDVEYLRDLLRADYSTAKLTYLSERVGMLILTDWFTELVLKGEIRQ